MVKIAAAMKTFSNLTGFDAIYWAVIKNSSLDAAIFTFSRKVPDTKPNT